MMGSKGKGTHGRGSGEGAPGQAGQGLDIAHFMGLKSASACLKERDAFPFDAVPVSYRLEHPDGSRRVLTMVGRQALLDGAPCEDCDCHSSNKIMARVGGSELALQLFPAHLGGTGLIRVKGAVGEEDRVISVKVSAEPELRASIDVQRADKTWIEGWAFLTLRPDGNGQPQASISMSQKPEESIPVAMLGGDGEPLAFMIFLGGAVTSNGGYLEGKLSAADSALRGEMYLQVPNPEYDPAVKGCLRFTYLAVAARGTWVYSDTGDQNVARLASELQSPHGSGRGKEVSLKCAPADLARPDALWRLLPTETEMSVGELIGMTPPEREDLGDAVCHGVVNCALLAAPEDWLEDLSIKRPVALPELAEIAADPANKEFFRKYAKAMGCSELSVIQMQPGWANVPGGWETVRSRMHYFWQGGATGCLGTDKDFLRVNEAITQVYFVEKMRAFQRYRDLSQARRSEFAQALLDGVTTEAMLMRMVSSDESSSIHKYITMFRALDKDGGFDKKFIASVNAAITAQAAKRLGAADFTSVQDYLVKTLRLLVDPQNVLKGEMMDKLRGDIAEMEARDKVGWMEFTDSIVDIAIELADLAVSLRNATWEQRLEAWKANARQRFPADPRRQRFYCEVGTISLTILNAGFAIFELISDVETWSHMRTDQQIAAVFNAAQQVAEVTSAVKSFVKYVRTPDEPISIEMDLFKWHGDFAVLPEEAIGSEAWEQALARNASKGLKYDIGVFSPFKQPLNALAVAVTVISMVSMGIQIHEDVEKGQPTVVIVFEILEEVVMAATILALPLTLEFPIVGAALAAVGIVLGIIDSCIPRNPPRIVVWARDVGTPLVLLIPDPAKDWERRTEALCFCLLAVGSRAGARMSYRQPLLLRLPWRPGQAAKAPEAGHPKPLIDMTHSSLAAEDLRPSADAIWGAIQSLPSVSDSQIADALIAQIAKSSSVGPVFFFQSGQKNILNLVDYSAAFADIGIWVMGYAISSNKYFSTVDGAACKANLVPTFKDKQLGYDLFLENLYGLGGFKAMEIYAKKETGVQILDMILAPGFIPLEFWKQSQNLFPCQVLLLLAKNWGCDLTDVRKRIDEWRVSQSVFQMADGEYNFFQSFLNVGDSVFFKYIDANQDIQNGLASTRPRTAGAALCNACSRAVWGKVTYTPAHAVPRLDAIPERWVQDINNVYGEPVADWVGATTKLPRNGPVPNIIYLKSIRLDVHKPKGFPAGTTADPRTDDYSSCFPGDAQVALEGGAMVPISSLRHGDRVLAIDRNGKRIFAEVFFFGHRDGGKSARFRRLRMEGGATLRLSGGHFVTVSDDSSWKGARFARASEVLAGQYVRVLPAGSPEVEARPARVIEVDDCECLGLYNPYTLDASTIVVDGVLASVHSDWFLDSIAPPGAMARYLPRYLPRIYDICLMPGRLVYRLKGPAWAEALQEELAIDEAAYSGTGLRALLRPYTMLAGRVIPAMLKRFLKRVRLHGTRHAGEESQPRLSPLSRT